MAAAIHDIVVEERSDLVLSIVWFDENDAKIDVDAYGAEFTMKPNKKYGFSDFVSITHEASSSGQIIVGDSDGEFLVQVSWDVLKVIAFKDGYWQLDVWPVAADSTDKRQRLAKGKFVVDKSL